MRAVVGVQLRALNELKTLNVGRVAVLNNEDGDLCVTWQPLEGCT